MLHSVTPHLKRLQSQMIGMNLALQSRFHLAVAIKMIFFQARTDLQIYRRTVVIYGVRISMKRIAFARFKLFLLGMFDHFVTLPCWGLEEYIGCRGSNSVHER